MGRWNLAPDPVWQVSVFDSEVFLSLVRRLTTLDEKDWVPDDATPGFTEEVMLARRCLRAIVGRFEAKVLRSFERAAARVAVRFHAEARADVVLQATRHLHQGKVMFLRNEDREPHEVPQGNWLQALLVVLGGENNSAHRLDGHRQPRLLPSSLQGDREGRR